MDKHIALMQQALNQASLGFEADEIPIGAVIVADNKIIAEAFNLRESSQNPMHHAEILVLEKAAYLKNNWRLNNCSIYVTAEPCPMCLGALIQARISDLYFGCFDDKRCFVGDQNVNYNPTGNADTLFFPSLKNKKQVQSNNHTLNVVGGILEDECKDLLQRFFAKQRISKT